MFCNSENSPCPPPPLRTPLRSGGFCSVAGLVAPQAEASLRSRRGTRNWRRVGCSRRGGHPSVLRRARVFRHRCSCSRSCSRHEGAVALSVPCLRQREGSIARGTIAIAIAIASSSCYGSELLWLRRHCQRSSGKRVHSGAVHDDSSLPSRGRPCCRDFRVRGGRFAAGCPSRGSVWEEKRKRTGASACW